MNVKIRTNKLVITLVECLPFFDAEHILMRQSRNIVDKTRNAEIARYKCTCRIFA